MYILLLESPCLLVRPSVRDKIWRLSALAHSTNDEYQESAMLFEPLYTRPERPKGAKDEVN